MKLPGLQNILRKKSGIRVRRQMSLPDGVRIYAIGDIHGRSDLLRIMHSRIQQDLEDRPVDEPIVVYMGDYVDRGPDSRGVIDTLIAGPAFDAQVRFLKGNHEDALLTFLNDPAFLQMWRDYGGLETLTSYGINVPNGGFGEDWIENVHSQFKAALPKSHLAFLQALELTYTNGDFFFVHAGIRPGVPLEEQQSADVMWIRDPFLNSKRFHGKIIVHGHTPQEQPVIRKNRIGIDTGAYVTGSLTSVVIEGTSFRFLQARKPKLRVLPGVRQA